MKKLIKFFQCILVGHQTYLQFKVMVQNTKNQGLIEIKMNLFQCRLCYFKFEGLSEVYSQSNKHILFDRKKSINNNVRWFDWFLYTCGEYF
jgi:hypothetical protein